MKMIPWPSGCPVSKKGRIAMYKINCEMLGSDATDEQARKIVEILQGWGYDVEFTFDCGSVNGEDEDPIPEDVWEKALAEV
jgi:hypothetical protein